MVQSSDLDETRALAHQASAQYPQFRLANFFETEVLSPMAGKEVAVAGSGKVRASSEPHDLLEEARLRASTPDQLGQLRPVQVMRMSRGTDFLVLVDAQSSRAYLLRNQDSEPVWISDFYATIGKRGFGKEKEGDQKTPLSLYTMQKEISKNKLTDFYAECAMPLDYPNALDRYLSHTGYGIWLHGVPHTSYNRPPRASDG
ncbi:MAG: hypothetical protein MO853_08985 [Candidatus Protistobacter heckmanni]|nr:hypothetical protein [Candidatus Protistobacter heckmanni]